MFFRSSSFWAMVADDVDRNLWELCGCLQHACGAAYQKEEVSRPSMDMCRSRQALRLAELNQIARAMTTTAAAAWSSPLAKHLQQAKDSQQPSRLQHATTAAQTPQAVAERQGANDSSSSRGANATVAPAGIPSSSARHSSSTALQDPEGSAHPAAVAAIAAGRTIVLSLSDR